jgi:hypothetical protein
MLRSARAVGQPAGAATEWSSRRRPGRLRAGVVAGRETRPHPARLGHLVLLAPLDVRQEHRDASAAGISSAEVTSKAKTYLVNSSAAMPSKLPSRWAVSRFLRGHPAQAR